MSTRVFVAGGVITIVVLAVVLAVVLTIPGSEPEPQLDRVTTSASQGTLVGQVVPEAAIFWGIPFSQPPVGEYRWAKPRPAVDFPERFWDATYQRSACIQICHQPAEEYSCPQNEQNEDCLYLNVWVPRKALVLVESDNIIEGKHYVIDEKFKKADKESFPVMMWMYGGAFNNGAGTVTIYDDRYLANNGDVVGVTMNYRTGPLGYLVQGTGDDAASGNMGAWDQIRALEWIRDNIQQFGGNPNKVTIFGQSAGAESAGVLMVTPESENLFHQTLMESNPFGLPFRDKENAHEFGAKFAMSAGCLRDDMDCLRRIDTDTILRAFEDTKLSVVGFEKLTLLFQPWGPVIDGDFLPKQPIDAFMAGEARDVPTLLGSTIDEGMLFVALGFPNNVSNVQYREIIRAVFKNQAGSVLDKYPPQCSRVPNSPCDNRYILNDIATEYLFICPQRATMRAMTKGSTFFYIFSQLWSFYELWEIPLCFDAVCHAAELPYVFNIANLTRYDYTEAETLFSTRVQWYWTNFAKYGTPNLPPNLQRVLTENDVEGIEYWEPFSEIGNGETDYALNLNANGDILMNDPYEDICVFWDELDSYADHYKFYDTFSKY